MRDYELPSVIESILFVSGGPVTLKKISHSLGISLDRVERVVDNLIQEYAQHRKNGGMSIVKHAQRIQMVSSPANSTHIEKFLKLEFQDNLSDASMETLAILVYRGPLTKSDIEHIRGVNCTLILRNLMIRGLIEKKKLKANNECLYQVSVQFLNSLGKKNVQEFPDYDKMHVKKINEEKPVNEEHVKSTKVPQKKSYNIQVIDVS